LKNYSTIFSEHLPEVNQIVSECGNPINNPIVYKKMEYSGVEKTRVKASTITKNISSSTSTSTSTSNISHSAKNQEPRTKNQDNNSKSQPFYNAVRPTIPTRINNTAMKNQLSFTFHHGIDSSFFLAKASFFLLTALSL